MRAASPEATCALEPQAAHYERAPEAIEKAPLLAEDGCEDLASVSPATAGAPDAAAPRREGDHEAVSGATQAEIPAVFDISFICK